MCGRLWGPPLPPAHWQRQHSCLRQACLRLSGLFVPVRPASSYRACSSPSGLLVSVRCSCWPRFWGQSGASSQGPDDLLLPRGRRTSPQLSHQGRKAHQNGQHNLRQAPGCGPEVSPPKVYRLTEFPGLLLPACQVRTADLVPALTQR